MLWRFICPQIRTEKLGCLFPSRVYTILPWSTYRIPANLLTQSFAQGCVSSIRTNQNIVHIGFQVKLCAFHICRMTLGLLNNTQGFLFDIVQTYHLKWIYHFVLLFEKSPTVGNGFRTENQTILFIFSKSSSCAQVATTKRNEIINCWFIQVLYPSTFDFYLLLGLECGRPACIFLLLLLTSIGSVKHRCDANRLDLLSFNRIVIFSCQSDKRNACSRLP